MTNALLAAWKKNPHPRIAKAIPLPAPFEGSLAAWRSAARKQADLGPLIASLFTGTLGEIFEKANAAAKWRDPRLSNELERLLREPPWSSDTSRSAWTAIFRLVTASKDPRFVELARELPAQWSVRASQKQWLASALKRAVADLPTLTALSPEHEALVASAEQAAPAPRKQSTGIDFASVYDAPRDDAPRLVLADALLEKGDPRGEFISLQLKATKTPADLKAEKALLKAHGKKWLAPFGTALGTEVKWRRGFPAEGLVKFRNGAEAKKYGALPEWATFESLTWTAPRTADHVAAAGFIGPAFRHLLHASGISLATLVAEKAPYQLRTICGEVGSVEGLKVILTSGVLPRLEALHVMDREFGGEWIRATKQWGSVKELGLMARWPSRLLPALAAAEATPLERLRVGTALCFHRAQDGSLSRLELLDARGTYLVEDQLSTLPGGSVTLLAPATGDWASGEVARQLERVVAKGKVASLAQSAAGDLDLNGLQEIRVVKEGLLVNDQSAIRVVNPKTFEVVRSLDIGHFHALGDDDVLINDRARVTWRHRTSAEERVVFTGKKLEHLVRSGDGTRAALRNGAKVPVFDAKTGAVLFEVAGYDPSLDATGRRLIVKVGQTVELHDLETRTKVVLDGWPYVPSFLADGRLAQSLKGRVKVWRPGGEELGFSYAPQVNQFLSNADGSKIVALGHKEALLFDGRTGKPIRKLPWTWQVAFLPDGRLVGALGQATSGIHLAEL